jgi:two-component system copper resistance phosphate regulon response regulator CusR
MKRVLVIEDELNLGRSICEGLSECGFSANHGASAQEALQYISNDHFDVIVSDIMMPETSGLELLKIVRSKGISTPFIFLTALGSTDDKVNGLEYGADDYLVKPFEFRELVARIKAVIKRSPENSILDSGPFRADLRGMSVTLNGSDLRLTRREFDLLLFLMKNAGRTVSKKQLTEQVWGLNFDTGTNTIEVYINYLRKKMENGDGARLIETVHGLGYRLNC